MEVDNYRNDFIVHLDEIDDIQFKRKGPKIVKNYILGEVLGEGAYGKVKDGMDTFTQKRVAVKILKRARLKKIPGGEASVLKEINITRKLHNKHIIKLIDHFTIDEKGKLYIVYEYIGGGTLQNLLESAPNHKLPLIQAQNIFNQLIQAIEYIHTQKILHRDIKPDNILFTNENLLKLSDFGVSEDSSLLDDFECLSRSYGSPAFQPPELTSFQRSFSPFKIDIWAMGVTLYLMTIGKFPFSGTNMYMLFENISRCNIELPSDTDKDLCDLIKGILQIDHNQRFTINQIKNHRWCTKQLEYETFIPLQAESKFDPLEMAYGNDDDLIFGYENDIVYQPHHILDESIHIPNIPPPTINLHLASTNNYTSSSSEGEEEDYKEQVNQFDSKSHHFVNNPTHHQSPLKSNNLTIAAASSAPSQSPLLSSNEIIDSSNPTPNNGSPQPPLRNSSNRRPKITFESPHNKSKCIVQ